MRHTVGLTASFTAFVLSVLLAACGGGGTEEAVPAPVNAVPIARPGPDQSVVAGTRVELDGSASSDADGDPITFAWLLGSMPAGSTAALAGAAGPRPSFTPDAPGTYTLTLTVNDGKVASAAATMTVTATAPIPPQIVVDMAEPVAGAVRLSLSGTVSGAVIWYVDLLLLGDGGTGPSAPLTWDTRRGSNGARLVMARIQTSPGTFEEVRRTVTVTNPIVSLNASVSGTSGRIAIDVRAFSDFGITSVSATLDGVSLGSLAAPNECSRFCIIFNDVYRFRVDATLVGSGNHTMVVTATDSAGNIGQITFAVPVSNAPAISLDSPTDGALVHGTLQVSGTATSDKGGSIAVIARLRDIEFLRGTGAGFSGSYDLAGLAPGHYTLTVRATDSTNESSEVRRSVIVTSEGSLAYPPLFTLPAGGRLLAAEGEKMLYSGGGGVILRDMGTGVEVILAGAAALQYADDWQLSGGHAYAGGKGADCVASCIYEWSPDGTLLNLSLANPYSRAANIAGGWAHDLHPVARAGVVVWVNDQAADTATQASTGRYTVYDVATGEYTRVGVPAGADRVGNWNYDFALVGGVVHFYFWAQTGGSGTSSTYDVFKWQSDTGATTRLTQGGGSSSTYPQTDGAMAVWKRAPSGGNADGTFTLVTQPIAGGPQAPASTNAILFKLRDGVLAWTEKSGTSRVIKASTPVATSTLSGSSSSSTLYANGAGQAIYGQEGSVYSWNSANGVSTLRLETAPSQVLVDGAAMVFTVGRTVYRVPL